MVLSSLDVLGNVFVNGNSIFSQVIKPLDGSVLVSSVFRCRVPSSNCLTIEFCKLSMLRSCRGNATRDWRNFEIPLLFISELMTIAISLCFWADATQFCKYSSYDAVRLSDLYSITLPTIHQVDLIVSRLSYLRNSEAY